MAFTATAQIEINVPPPSYYCDQDGNGTVTIDLNDYNAYILGSNNPEEYSVSYFLTEDDARHNTSVLPYLYTLYVSATPQELFARVTEIANTDNFAGTILDIRVVPIPDAVTLPVINSLYCTGSEYDLTLNNGLHNPLHEVSFYSTETDASAGTNAIANPDFYVTNEQSVWVRVASVPSVATAPACFIILQQRLNPYGILQLSAVVAGNTVTFIATGGTPVSYSIISGPQQGSYPTPAQTSNVFTDLAPGMYSIQVLDYCGNMYTYSIMIVASPEPPTGETSQTFTEGQTLADLEVSGDNVVWYDAATEGNVLPITTPLTDGTTYYAERAGGRLRALRLAVTVHLVLSNNSNALQTLTYYPNPVKNMLNVKNAAPINSIAVYSTIGQQVMHNTINATETNLDLSSLSNGIYFVKVQAGESSKTIRVVKE